MAEEKILIEHLDGERVVHADRSCFRNGEVVGKYIGGGSSGEVNVICLKDEIQKENMCGHVIKAIDLEDEETNESSVLKEISMNKITSKLGLGPRYVKDFQCFVDISTKGDRQRRKLYINSSCRKDSIVTLAHIWRSLETTRTPERK